MGLTLVAICKLIFYKSANASNSTLGEEIETSFVF